MSPNLKRTLRRILRESSEVRPVLSFGAVLVHAPLGRGLRGEVVVRLGKDRAGAVSPHCGPLRKSDHTQEAARVVFDSTGTSLEIAVNPPATGADRDGGYRPFRPTYLMGQVSRVIEENPGADRDGGYRPFRPTYLMEQVSRVIEQNPGKLTKNQATNKVRGKRHQDVVDAFDLLVSEEIYLEATDERYPHYTSTRPYRETDDPASDKYDGPNKHADWAELHRSETAIHNGQGTSPQEAVR